MNLFPSKLAPTSSWVGLALFFLQACGGSQQAPAPTAQTVPTETVGPESPDTALPSAAEVLDRYIEVTGGVDAYTATKSLKVTGTIELLGQGMNGTTTVLVDGSKLLQAAELTGIGSITVGSDGTTVWMMDPMTGARIVTGIERSQLLRSTDLLAAVKWKEQYKTTTLTGTEDIGGKPAYVIEMVDVDDIPETRYYDLASGLLVKAKGIAKSQGGDVPTETTYDNYTAYGGLMMAATSTVKQGPVSFVATTAAVEINPTIDPSAFALPAEITAIRDAKGAK